MHLTNNSYHPMLAEADHKLIYCDLIRKDSHLLPTVDHLMAVDNLLMANDKYLTTIDIQLLSGDNYPMAFASVLIRINNSQITTDHRHKAFGIDLKPCVNVLKPFALSRCKH